MLQTNGSRRASCTATTELEDVTEKGIQWGDRKFSKGIFTHALVTEGF